MVKLDAVLFSHSVTSWGDRGMACVRESWESFFSAGDSHALSRKASVLAKQTAVYARGWGFLRNSRIDLNMANGQSCTFPFVHTNWETLIKRRWFRSRQLGKYDEFNHLLNCVYVNKSGRYPFADLYRYTKWMLRKLLSSLPLNLCLF